MLNFTAVATSQTLALFDYRMRLSLDEIGSTQVTWRQNEPHESLYLYVFFE